MRGLHPRSPGLLASTQGRPLGLHTPLDVVVAFSRARLVAFSRSRDLGSQYRWYRSPPRPRYLAIVPFRYLAFSRSPHIAFSLERVLMQSRGSQFPLPVSQKDASTGGEALALVVSHGQVRIVWALGGFVTLGGLEQKTEPLETQRPSPGRLGQMLATDLQGGLTPGAVVMQGE